MLYSSIRCAKVSYSYYLKFPAVNENFVNRKQGVRFGQFLVCGLVKIHWNSPNHTQQTYQAVHPVSYRQHFHSLLEILHNKNSRLCTMAAWIKHMYRIFVISWVFSGTNFQLTLLSQSILCLQGTIRWPEAAPNNWGRTPNQYSVYSQLNDGNLNEVCVHVHLCMHVTFLYLRYLQMRNLHIILY